MCYFLCVEVKTLQYPPASHGKGLGFGYVLHQLVMFPVDGWALLTGALMVIPIAAVMQIYSVLTLMPFRSLQHCSTGAGFKHARVLLSGSVSSAFFLQIFLLNFISTYQQLLFAPCKSLWHAGLSTYEKPIEAWLSPIRPVASRPLCSPGYKGIVWFCLIAGCTVCDALGNCTSQSCTRGGCSQQTMLKQPAAEGYVTEDADNLGWRCLPSAVSLLLQREIMCFKEKCPSGDFIMCPVALPALGNFSLPVSFNYFGKKLHFLCWGFEAETSTKLEVRAKLIQHNSTSDGSMVKEEKTSHVQ